MSDPKAPARTRVWAGLDRALHRDVADQLERGRERPVLWCVVDDSAPSTCDLVDRLVDTWGDGLVYLSGVAWRPQDLPGLPAEARSRILQHVRVRLWSAPDATLREDRMLESLRHGCLPIQVVPDLEPWSHNEETGFPAAMVLRVGLAGPIELLSSEELDRRAGLLVRELRRDS